MKSNSIIQALAALALGFVVSVATPASAATGTLTGYVVKLKTSYSNSYGNTFFEVNDTATITGCNKDGSYTLALIPDTDRGKQMFSIVEAALLSGRSLTISLDTSLSANGYCWVKDVTYTRQ